MAKTKDPLTWQELEDQFGHYHRLLAEDLFTLTNEEGCEAIFEFVKAQKIRERSKDCSVGKNKKAAKSSVRESRHYEV